MEFYYFFINDFRFRWADIYPLKDASRSSQFDDKLRNSFCYQDWYGVFNHTMISNLRLKSSIVFFNFEAIQASLLHTVSLEG